MPAHTLPELFAHIPIASLSPLPALTITGISHDSRQIQPGWLFIALSDGQTDAHRFIPDAVARGALAVVGETVHPDCPLPYICVPNARRALAYLSAAFYQFPARKLTIIGVTGTDGKTTTSALIHHILQAAGLRAGMITTVAAHIGQRALDTGFHVTTPEAPDVQRYLAEMVAAGLTHVVLEATSHGLAQERVTACEFDLGVVTNITHEHLDYHGSYAQYAAAKARLFTSLMQTAAKPQGNFRTAVLNFQDNSYPLLKTIPVSRQITYAIGQPASVRAENIQQSAQGVHFTAQGSQGAFEVDCPLVGNYNVYNILAAIAATLEGLGLPVVKVQRALAGFPGVPGRMEVIDMGQNFQAIVDFAHTPNALEQALKTGRQLTSGRVIVVFGSAGLRDRAKRRMMAEVSAQLADMTILTAEDPRTEPLDDILAEMASGAVSQGAIEGQTFWRIPDRREALRFAVRQAYPGDVLLACGKGHEQSMCFGVKEYLWDDRIALRAALAEKLGVDGPPMPFLPPLVE